MKPCRYLATLTVVLMLTGVLEGGISHARADTSRIRITAIVEHPALDAVRKGVWDELAEQGFKDGGNMDWEFQSAQGDMGIAGQIARKFVGDEPDVIVAIATPSAQAVVAAARGSVPVVFSAVTDPVDAKLVKDPGHPGGNVTGVSDMLPVAKHLALIREVVPEVRTIGIPYNPGEANAAVLVDRVKEIAPGLGLKIITASAPNSGDVLMAARSLVGKVDVIYVTTDNTIVSAFESVAKVGMDAQIPVFAGDTDTVTRGAVAAIGFDYYDVGRQTGAVVVRILKGEKAGDIPVQGVETTKLYLNPKAARKMGIELPDALMKRATRVID